MMNNRRRTNNFTYVSSCVKYMIFMLNFVFWLFGGLLIGVGLYAFVDKWQATGSVRVENVYDVILNISLVMVIAGAVVFVVSFAGCVGALRENTCLLKFQLLVLYFHIHYNHYWKSHSQIKSYKHIEKILIYKILLILVSKNSGVVV